MKNKVFFIAEISANHCGNFILAKKLIKCAHVNLVVYNFFDKYIIKLIMFITGGPTDTSQSYEFTDWSKVDNFAKELKIS